MSLDSAYVSQSSKLGMRWQHRIPCLKAQDGKPWEVTSSVIQGRWLFLRRGSWRPRKSVLSTHGPCASFSLLVWAGPFDLVLSFPIPWNTGPCSSSHPYSATVTYTSMLVLCLCRYIWWWLEKSLILSSACHEDLSLNSRTHAEKPGMVAFASNTSTGEVETGISPINLIRPSYYMIGAFQANERPCLENQGGWSLRNHTPGLRITALHMPTGAHIHKQHLQFSQYSLCGLFVLSFNIFVFFHQSTHRESTPTLAGVLTFSWYRGSHLSILP